MATEKAKEKVKNDKPGVEANVKEETKTLPEDKRKAANKIIMKRVLAASGVGLVPFPLIDLVAATGIQLETVKRLADLYDIEFKKDIAKTLVSSLIGSTLITSTGPLVASAIKIIPFVGQAAGVVTLPILLGGTTYAIGEVFARHFEVGGTLLTFDAEKVRAYYEEQFEKGKAFTQEAAAKK